MLCTMKIQPGAPLHQTPQAYYPVAPYEVPRRKLRRLPFLFLIPIVLFATLFFGGSYLVSPEPDIEVQPGIGFATVSGRDAVLVPYDRHGPRGMFQLMFQDMFQVRLAARDAGTGDLLWDTQLSDDLIWEASVLASGDRYAYVATDSGLVVLDLANGAKVAERDGIEGLGQSFIAARWAYRYDATNRRVVAMGGDGQVRLITLDTATASPADPATAAQWAPQLTERTQSRPGNTVSRAKLGDQLVALAARPGGGPGHLLVRMAPDGEATPIGDTVFQQASIVVDDAEVPAGSATEHLLVVHNRAVNDTTKALSAVSLATGEVTATIPIESTSFGTPVMSPRGVTAIGVGPTVAELTPDGRLTALPVGSADFFGNPS